MSDINSGVHVPVDQARSLLYYTFAANEGDQISQMALGYRYWSGIGVNENCLMALGWYEAAAEQGTLSPQYCGNPCLIEV